MLRRGDFHRLPRRHGCTATEHHQNSDESVSHACDAMTLGDLSQPSSDLMYLLNSDFFRRVASRSEIAALRARASARSIALVNARTCASV